MCSHFYFESVISITFDIARLRVFIFYSWASYMYLAYAYHCIKCWEHEKKQEMTCL